MSKWVSLKIGKFDYKFLEIQAKIRFKKEKMFSKMTICGVIEPPKILYLHFFALKQTTNRNNLWFEQVRGKHSNKESLFLVYCKIVE